MLKLKKKHLLILFISILGILILFGGYYLYLMRSHQSEASIAAGNLVIEKDYYVGNGANPVAKHVYIIRDKYTDTMYINIDTLDTNQKPVTAAFGPYYDGNNNLMTYTHWLQLTGDKKALKMTKAIKQPLPVETQNPLSTPAPTEKKDADNASKPDTPSVEKDAAQ